MSYYDPPELDLEPIIYRSKWVTTNKDHKCRLCDRTIPAHSKALYTFSLCGHRPQYGYQCPMSMYPHGYCNYEVGRE